MTTQLVKRHVAPVLECDPKGPEWQRGSVFNPAVLRFGNEWRMLVRGTQTEEFGVEGGYTSRIGVAESDDGISWTLRSEPLIVPTLDAEMGLGCEDPRATVVSIEGDDPKTAEVVVFYNCGALPGTNGAPDVRVLSAILKNDFTEIEKHGVFLGVDSPATIRMKAAALFPRPLDNGNWPVVFTFGSESPYGTLMYAELTLSEVAAGISASDLAQWFVNDRDTHVFLEPPSPVERGPEVGAAPIAFGDDYVMFYCPANETSVRQWGAGALLLDGATRRPIGHIPDLMVPELDGELTGVVNNVAFPSGAVMADDDELRIYYGAGDKSIYMASGSMTELVSELRRRPLVKRTWPY